MAKFVEGIVIKDKKMVSGRGISQDIILQEKEKLNRETLEKVIKKYKERLGGNQS